MQLAKDLPLGNVSVYLAMGQRIVLALVNCAVARKGTLLSGQNYTRTTFPFNDNSD